MKALTPSNEQERLAALRRYRILDTAREVEFDGITELVAQICDVPVAVINLIDEGRQWFKSEIGLGVRETPLDTSFCAHAILEEDVMVVPDATQDERFNGNPLVTGEPGLRSYAGALLKTEEGLPIGTLCVLDTKPRKLEAHQIRALRTLANQVMQLMELRRELAAREALSEQLSEAMKAREQVLAVVSHDLRTPLSIVLMTAEHLRTLKGGDLLEQSAERLHRAVSTMRRLVDDLLDFESMDLGRMAFDMARVEVEWLLREQQRSVAGEAKERQVAVRVLGGESMAVRCDAGRMLQALGNIVTNALKVSPPGSVVTAQAERRGEQVCITVEDSGPGIDEATAARLFEPFWRGADARERGIGLGLAITKRIIAAHQGTITVANAPSGGASFTICLPAVD